MRSFAPLPQKFWISVACSIGLLLSGYSLHTSRGQDAPPPAVQSPTDLVDQIMGLVGQERVDESIALMDGLKNQPDLRESAHARLNRLREDEGNYRSYEIAAIQRFTGQFETLDVLAYYDEQPVLFRFHFYRPQKQDNVKWIVLGFQVTTAMEEITDVLKDTPVDYVGHGK